MVNEPSISALYDALAHPSRRIVIDVLSYDGESRALADLAREIAAREDARAADGEIDDSAEEIYIDLYHRHIGKLERAGVVEYDPESGVVRFTDHPRLAKIEQRWDVVQPECENS